MRLPPFVFFLALAACMAELPQTSLGFKCAEERDCATGDLVCVAGVCVLRDASINGGVDDGGVDDGGVDDGGVDDGGPAVWRLVGYRSDFGYTLTHPRELPWRGQHASNPTVIQSHAQELLWAHVNGGVISWNGYYTWSSENAIDVFEATEALPLRWALLYENEPTGTPPASEVADILGKAKTYFAEAYSNYLRIDGAFVFFVAASKPDAGGCNAASRWVQGNRMADSPAFLVLVAPGDPSSVAGCPDQPDAWRLEEAQPLGLTEQVATLTPSVWPWTKTRALARDVVAFEAAVRAANDGGQRIQYINSFNFWWNGTAIESGYEWVSDGGTGKSWASDSGMGVFIDALHAHPPITR